MTGLEIIKKFRLIVIILMLVGLCGSLAFSWLTPVYYDTSLSFSINRINRQETAEYQYDGYYSIQASDLFSQTVMSWLMTPSVLLEIYQKAGIDPKISSLEELISRFKTKKYSAQNIVVRYRERDYKSAEKIATAINEVISSKASTANQTADQKSLFEINGSKPVIIERKPVYLVNGLVGLFAGLVIGLVTSYIIAYWRKPEQQ